MNNIRTLICLLMLSALSWFCTGFSQTRSLADAERIANTYLSQARKGAPRGDVPALQPSMHLRMTSSELLKTVGKEPAFYVFTPQDANMGGFVIVSGIEEASPVLGYSYTDDFDVANMPPAMLYLLGKYQEEIDAYLSLPANEKQKYISSNSGKRESLPIQGNGVSPMITTCWNQDAPFNNLCPKDGNTRSATGCAATAAAQVMKFYEYPTHGNGSISYTTATKHLSVSYNFGSTTFDWSNMIDNYNGSYTSTQATAVATLMAACGAAFQMDYTSSASGTSADKQMSGLINYFDYDADMALLLRDYMTAEQWHLMILDQLNSNHPVIFAGQSEDGGHSFVLDGYVDDDDDNPSYHVNWGWGGYYDNYFKVNALDPSGQGIGGSSGGYNYDQQILFGCQPDNNQIDHGCIFLGENLIVSPLSVRPNSSESVSITLQSFYNFSNKSFTGDLLLYLKKGTQEFYLGKKSGFYDIPLLSGYSSYPVSVTLPSNLSEGTYELIIKTKQTGSNIEEPIYWKTGNAKIVVSDTGVDPDAPELTTDLQTTAFDLVTYSGRYIETSVAEIINMSDVTFSGEVKLALADNQGNMLTTFGEASSISNLGHYYNLVYPRTLRGSIPAEYCVDGHYRLYVASNQTGYSGWSYLRGYSLEGNYIVDYDRECYLDLWITGGEIGVPTYSVTTSCSAGGHVEASKNAVESNGQVTFTIVPDEDYDLSKAYLNGVDVTKQVVNYQYTVTNVSEDLLFEVTFCDAPASSANLQVTGFELISSQDRTVSVELSQIANLGNADFSGVVSLALADRNNNLVSVFGERTEIDGLGNYQYLTYPRTLTSTIPQEVSDSYYRLCVVAKQKGRSGWNIVKKYKLENNSITAKSLDCFMHIWLVDGILCRPTFSVTTQVTGNGSVTPSAQSVDAGGKVTFTVQAETGYYLSAATLNEVNILSSISGNKYVVDEVIEDLKFSATFSAKTYVLTYKVDGTVYKTVEYAYGSAITPEAAPEKEGYTFSGWSDIPTTMPDHDVTVNGSFVVNSYTLTYKVDGEVYKTVDFTFGAAITPEAAPEKEGYSFLGWSEIPATMPAHDVEVNGSFAINNYTLTYYVDGAVYKSVEYAYGAAITPEDSPEKDGYTFSGWSEIPATMPAYDVTVNGSFIVNNYTLTYKVDGAVYKTVEYAFGAAITPEATPEKEGYTFSGWSEIPTTMPAHDVEVTGSFAINNYILTYYVDGAVYKSVEYAYGAAITPEASPEKEGYTFSGWSEIPSTMPAYDVTVNGSFLVNNYTLTYKVDGAVHKTVEYAFGAAITPEASPEKEGYTFSGWSDIPATMPAHDVEVTGSFAINNYTLTYYVDGAVYKTIEYTYGAAITPEASPEKEGYTFSGWSEIPATMPAYDVDIYGTFNVNSYHLTWVIDGEIFLIETLEYGQSIVAPIPDTREGYDFAWNLENVPETMPAKDLFIYGYYTVGLDDIICDNHRRNIVYDLQGRQVRELTPGNVYIRDGKKFFYMGE